MVVHAVMRAWQVSRQQYPSTKQKLPQFLLENGANHGLAPPERGVTDRDRGAQIAGVRAPRGDAVDDDAPLNVLKHQKIIPVRRGPSAPSSDGDGFWTSHLFWKGIVLGVFAVVVIKTVLAVQMPFGIDWYGF